jgi:hypothetical protein
MYETHQSNPAANVKVQMGSKVLLEMLQRDSNFHIFCNVQFTLDYLFQFAGNVAPN